MSERFFVDHDFREPTVTLTGAESHHLTHVLRKRIGDAVTLFNGRGLEAQGAIHEIARKQTVVRITGVRELPGDGGRDVTLAVAVPKGERFRWLVEKAAELGVRRLIPLQTTRSVVAPGEGKLGKARQAAIEAAKQCGAARLMEIDDLTDWQTLLDNHPDMGAAIFVAHPGGTPLADALAAIDPQMPLLLGVGPEGGFTDEEVAAARFRGAISVDLGPRILRVETAALSLAACARLTAPHS